MRFTYLLQASAYTIQMITIAKLLNCSYSSLPAESGWESEDLTIAIPFL